MDFVLEFAVMCDIYDELTGHVEEATEGSKEGSSKVSGAAKCGLNKVSSKLEKAASAIANITEKAKNTKTDGVDSALVKQANAAAKKRVTIVNEINKCVVVLSKRINMGKDVNDMIRKLRVIDSEISALEDEENTFCKNGKVKTGIYRKLIQASVVKSVGSKTVTVLKTAASDIKDSDKLANAIAAGGNARAVINSMTKAVSLIKGTTAKALCGRGGEALTDREKALRNAVIATSITTIL